MKTAELKKLIDHVGCGDLDNYGECKQCSTIRSLLLSMVEPSKHCDCSNCRLWERV